MAHPSQVIGTAWPAVPFEGSRRAERTDHWQLARAAHVDLLLMGMPRINLLLIAPDEVVRQVLSALLLDLWEPVSRWHRGASLTLPEPSAAGTLILDGVEALTISDQQLLLRWLEVSRGRTQVVSTTSAPLLPCVDTGQFNATLFYRLNTVCVDVSTLASQPLQES
jgi:hypothetical protein